MIVGLGFRARSGKDTVGEYLQKEYGFERIAFADALKRGCMEMFGLTYEQAYGNLKEVVDEYWSTTPRYILQKVGTECMRNGYKKDIWIKSVDKRIREQPNSNWVVTDCRFPNEAAAIKSWDGLVVRVDRTQAGASGGITDHPSELAMEAYDKWDYVIKNNSDSLVDLYNSVDHMVDAFVRHSGK